MVSFVNFARIESICVGFHLGTLHGYFFHQDFWPNLNFPLEYQIKLVLILKQSFYEKRAKSLEKFFLQLWKSDFDDFLQIKEINVYK